MSEYMPPSCDVFALNVGFVGGLIAALLGVGAYKLTGWALDKRFPRFRWDARVRL